MGSSMGSDPRLSAAIGVILGMGSAGFSSMNPGDDEDGDAPMKPAPTASKAKAAPVVEEVTFITLTLP
jgi:hypothetical protein